MTKSSSPKDVDGADFLREMAINLDGALDRLRANEMEAIAHIGQERVEELFEFWSTELANGQDLYEFLLRATDRERALIRLWNRLDRLGDSRKKAGRALMNSGVVTSTTSAVAGSKSGAKE